MISWELRKTGDMVKDLPNFFSDFEWQLLKSTGLLIDYAIFVNCRTLDGVFSYESNGLTSHYYMDEPMLPSLLGLSYIGFVRRGHWVYKNIKFQMTFDRNPYYVRGHNYIGMVGPPPIHDFAWPMSQLSLVFGEPRAPGIRSRIKKIRDICAAAGVIPAGVHINTPNNYTRLWFPASSSYFAQAILDVAKRHPGLIFKKPKSYQVGDEQAWHVKAHKKDPKEKEKFNKKETKEYKQMEKYEVGRERYRQKKRMKKFEQQKEDLWKYKKPRQRQEYKDRKKEMEQRQKKLEQQRKNYNETIDKVREERVRDEEERKRKSKEEEDERLERVEEARKRKKALEEQRRREEAEMKTPKDREQEKKEEVKTPQDREQEKKEEIKVPKDQGKEEANEPPRNEEHKDAQEANKERVAVVDMAEEFDHKFDKREAMDLANEVEDANDPMSIASINQGIDDDDIDDVDDDDEDESSELSGGINLQDWFDIDDEFKTQSLDPNRLLWRDKITAEWQAAAAAAAAA
ncbi:hypothetical protein CDD81_6434 [Ophiocordyceps australis]|uniref:Uncharacterized protein n=1 Tax=Ophiocordyceps australis TaxID=1399860 RepID=A0A2C5YCZ8_9HYPO|nr:hypothetical protein CDD81_6434 [Ophiocordyceps australis]